MTLIEKIKRKLGRCDDCWRKAEYHFELHDVEYFGDEPTEVVIHFHNCFKHAEISGFCLGCGGFWGGVESFGSKIKAYCSDCAEELEYDMGIHEDQFGEYYGPFEDYDDYGRDFSEKSPIVSKVKEE